MKRFYVVVTKSVSAKWKIRHSSDVETKYVKNSFEVKTLASMLCSCVNF